MTDYSEKDARGGISSVATNVNHTCLSLISRLLLTYLKNCYEKNDVINGHVICWLERICSGGQRLD